MVFTVQGPVFEQRLNESCGPWSVVPACQLGMTTAGLAGGYKEKTMIMQLVRWNLRLVLQQSAECSSKRCCNASC